MNLLDQLKSFRDGVDAMLFTIKEWEGRIAQRNISPYVMQSVKTLQAGLESLDMCIQGDNDTAQQTIHLAVEAADIWKALETDHCQQFSPFKDDIYGLNRNDVALMYSSVMALTELLTDWEQSVVTQRLRADEGDEGTVFDRKAVELLTRIRAIRACCEAAITCLERQPQIPPEKRSHQISPQKMRVAQHEIEAWHMLQKDA